MQKIQEKKTVIQKTSKEIRNKMYSITASFVITVHSAAQLTAKRSIWNNDRRAIFLLINLKLIFERIITSVILTQTLSLCYLSTQYVPKKVIFL